MGDKSIRILHVDARADYGRAGPPSDRRHFASAAARAVLAAAMLVAATMVNSHAVAQFRPAPTGDGTTQHYFTVEFSGGRVDSLTRQQVAAAFGSKLAAANVEVPKGDFDAAVDNAARQLANWNGKGSLSFCVPRVCWEVFVNP
jgi:hypothetical protein